VGTNSFDEGLRLIQHLGGAERPAVLDLFESLGEAEFGKQCVGFVYGDVYHRPGLTLPERQLATVGALTALGYATSQLQFHAKAALKAGCTQRQVLEAIVQAGSVTDASEALAAVEEAFAETGEGPGEQLTPKQREIVMIAACTALGTVTPELKAHLHALLDVGGTRQELVETLLHLAFYAGFPAALNAMGVAKEVLAGR
jgi:alkylhydroperoxidase/carboxymuconolactone decarboxylase family protein YurZ